jgi:hypothetical protein
MWMGLEISSVTWMRMGAPIEICRALAPTILAFSKRVSFGGPIKLFFSVSDVF